MITYHASALNTSLRGPRGSGEAASLRRRGGREGGSEKVPQASWSEGVSKEELLFSSCPIVQPKGEGEGSSWSLRVRGWGGKGDSGCKTGERKGAGGKEEGSGRGAFVWLVRQEGVEGGSKWRVNNPSKVPLLELIGRLRVNCRAWSTWALLGGSCSQTGRGLTIGVRFVVEGLEG